MIKKIKNQKGERLKGLSQGKNETHFRSAKQSLLRPKCPKCGTENPVGNGQCWRCKKCGKSFVKISNPRIKIPSPSCPHCLSDQTESYGREWRCRSCGRYTLKIKNPRQKSPENLSIKDLYSGKIIDI